MKNIIEQDIKSLKKADLLKRAEMAEEAIQQLQWMLAVSRDAYYYATGNTLRFEVKDNKMVLVVDKSEENKCSE